MEKIQSMSLIEKLPKNELKNLLKQVNLYSNLSRKLGKRGRDLFHKLLIDTHSYKLEYMPGMGEDKSWEVALPSFEKAFGFTPHKDDVTFIANSHLLGGIRIFQDDNMLDLSLSMVTNQIK